jgi:hypothetical protein
VEKPIISEAGKITRAAKITTFLFLTLKNNPLLRNWVHFLNVFLFLAGPEGLNIKNFKIWTRYNYKVNPRGCMLISLV